MRIAYSKGIVIVALIAVAAVAASGLVLAAGAQQELLERGQSEYDKHNYKQALKLAEQILAVSPQEALLRRAQRLKAMSLCKLRDESAYRYAEEIMAEHDPFAADAELWQAMGDDRFQQYDHKRAYKYYMKATELFEKSSALTAAADAYFQAAECLRRRHDIVPTQQAVRNWQERQRISVDEIFQIYDHIVELNIDDDRKARALLLAGKVAREVGSWEYAQKGLERLTKAAEKFGQTPSAPVAQYEKGQIYQQFSRFVEAVGAYRKVITNFSDQNLAKQAKKRIDEITAPRIAVLVAKPYLPGEKAKLYWQIRNVKKLSLKAYRLDLPALLGRLKRPRWHAPGAGLYRHALEGQPDPVAAWTFTTPDEGGHQVYSHWANANVKQTALPISVPFDGAGAYLIHAEGVNPDNKMATSRCLLIFSNISAVGKSDSDQTLLFVSHAVTGRPVHEADVTVGRFWSNRRIDTESGKTNDAGLADIRFLRRRSYNWLAAVRKGEDQAICARGGYYWHWWGYGQQYKVYGFTDRPVYRPGHTVNFKQILRAHKEGTYQNFPDKKVHIEIRDPKGQTIYGKDLLTDEFGTVEGSLALKADAPLGIYHIQVSVEGARRRRFYAEGNRFRVEEYKKPEFKVTVEPDRPDYRVGDEVRIKISARYYFGQPVVGAEVRFGIRKQSYVHRRDWPRPWRWYYEDLHYGRGHRPWWRPRFDELLTTGTVKTDANGEAIVTVKAEPIKGHESLDLKFLVRAEITDAARRVIRGRGEVKVTHAPFFIYPKPTQSVYGPGDSVEIDVKTENPNGQGVPGKFTVEAWRIERIRKVVKKGDEQRVKFEEKLAQKVFSGEIDIAETGRGRVRFAPDMTGRFKVIVRQARPKQGQPPVEGACELWIASKTGAEAHYAYNNLELIPASDQYEIGQTMKVLVNTSKGDSYVLLTAEADELLFHRVVHVEKNSKLVEIPVEKNLTPNFTLSALLLRDNKLFRDTKKIVVPPTYRFIKVDLEIAKGSMDGGKDNTFQPREKTKVRIRLTDMRTQKPVAGQVAVMLVDSSIYYIQPEFRQAIEKAFYGFVRSVRVGMADSFAGPASLNPPQYRRGFRERGHLVGSRAQESLPASAALVDRSEAMSDRRMAKGAAPGEPKPLVEPLIREHFRDTVLWAGSVVTDADGTAELPVTLPDQLTTFALHVISFDKDTRVGQGKADVVTTKRIIARLESGRFFTEGDHSYVTVIAHNYFDGPQELMVDLTASENLKLRKVNLAGRWQDYKAGEELPVTVPAGGEVRLDFLTTALQAGQVKLLARVRGAGESDAIRLAKPIVPWGARKIVGAGGVLRGVGVRADQWSFTVPEEIKAGSQSLTVTLSPSVAAVAMEALPFLARYPYGCVEQTMSRFLPTVVMRKTLHDAGVNLDEVRELIEQQSAAEPKLAAKYKLIRQRMKRNPVYSAAEMGKMIAAGLKRLADMQHGDGGWGWWKHDHSNPYMTAYVTYGLVVARDSDVKLPRRMLKKAREFLIRHASQPKRDDVRNWWRRHLNNDNTRIYVLYVIGRLDAAALGKAKLKAHLERIYEARDELTDYGRALLALTLHAAGRKEQARIVVENFDNTAVVDQKSQTAHWGRLSGWWYWYHGATESTAWVLQAMLAVAPEGEYVPMAVNWLVRNRRELAWHNTKATAMAIYALAHYAKTAGELDCDQTFEVVIDESLRRKIRVGRENLFTFDGRIEIAADQLPPGEHTVRIARNGTGSLYWGAYLRYFTTAERIEGGGHQLAIDRKYFRLVPEEFTNTRKVWKEGKYVTEQFPDLRYNKEPLAFGAEIASGQKIEVQLTIEADNHLEYMVFEDPKPAGCEPYRLTSGASYGGGTYANLELRDTKVVFFASYLRKGKQTLSYKLVCEQPGTFRVLPSGGEAMYSPFVEAISDSGKLVITTRPQKAATGT